MKENNDIKQEGAEPHGGRNNGFKKKNKFKKHAQTNNYTVDQV